MDFGMMAGGAAEGLSPLPGLMMEGRKMAQQQAQFDQETQIKQAAMLIDMLKDPNIPGEVKESHLYPKFRSLYNLRGGVQLPEMPEGTWSSTYNKMFGTMSKLKDRYYNSQGTDKPVSLSETVNMMDAYSTRMLKQEDIKRQKEDMDEFISGEILKGNKGYEGKYVPNAEEKLSEFQVVPQKMSREEQDLYMTKLSPDRRAFVEKTRDKMRYVTPDGKEQYLSPSEYNQVKGYTQHGEYNDYMKAAKAAYPERSDIEHIQNFEAMKQKIAQSISPPEWKDRYDSYVKDMKAQGKASEIQPRWKFEEDYQARVAGLKARQQAEANLDAKREGKQKDRDAKTASRIGMAYSRYKAKNPDAMTLDQFKLREDLVKKYMNMGDDNL